MAVSSVNFLPFVVLMIIVPEEGMAQIGFFVASALKSTAALALY